MTGRLKRIFLLYLSLNINVLEEGNHFVATPFTCIYRLNALL